MSSNPYFDDSDDTDDGAETTSWGDTTTGTSVPSREGDDSGLPAWAQIQADIATGADEPGTHSGVPQPAQNATSNTAGNVPQNLIPPSPQPTPTPVTPSKPTAPVPPPARTGAPARPTPNAPEPTPMPIPVPVAVPSTAQQPPAPEEAVTYAAPPGTPNDTETFDSPPFNDKEDFSHDFLASNDTDARPASSMTRAQPSPKTDPFVPATSFDGGLDDDEERAALIAALDEEEDFDENDGETEEKGGLLSRFSGGKSRSKTAKKSSKKGKAGRKTSNNGKTGNSNKSGKAAGGRWKVVAFRTVLWTVLAIIAIGGIKNLVKPNPFTLEEAVTEVTRQVQYDGFPTAAGQAMAERFVTVYLTQKPEEQSVRQEALLAYLPKDSRSGADTWTLGDSAEQSIVSGPYLSGPPQVSNDACNTAEGGKCMTYSFAAQVRDAGEKQIDKDGNIVKPKWLYLTVPIVSTPSGLAVAGAPAFTSPQAVSQTGAPLVITKDDAAADQITQPLEGFFAAWAASSTTPTDDLNRYLNAESKDSARVGLSGAVKFNGLSQIAVTEPDALNPSLRMAFASVEWAVAGGKTTYIQSYRLSVQQGEDNKWYILDVQGGSFGSQ